MAEKRRYTVSLPDHVADAVEAQAKPLGATPTEYAGDIVRWWFGQGCPPVTHDEQELRKRILPVPSDLNVWSLDPKRMYSLTDDAIVQKLLNQLGLPNLFAQAAEHDVVSVPIAFDNHPTHWLLITFFKGSDRPDGDGLSFLAYSKGDTPRKEMVSKLQRISKDLQTSKPIEFSQIPAVEKAALKSK